jgi:hypothetical protein
MPPSIAIPTASPSSSANDVLMLFMLDARTAPKRLTAKPFVVNVRTSSVNCSCTPLLVFHRRRPTVMRPQRSRLSVEDTADTV